MNIMISIVLNSSFVGLLLVLFALQRPETLAAAGLLCALYAAFRTRLATMSFHILEIALFAALTLITAIAALELGLNRGFSPVFYLLSTLSAYYAAKKFASSPLKRIRRSLEVVFWLAVIAIAVGLYLYWDAPEPLGEIIPGSSTNGLPSYLIVLQVALAIAVVIEVGALPVLPAIATFVIAVFGLGRGSILVAALILAFTCIFNIFFGRGPWSGKIFRRWMIVWLSGAFIVCGYLWQAGIFNLHLVETKWAAMGLSDPHRATMLSDYVSKLDGWSVLFGTDYSGTSIEALYGGNPHNSYIRLHSYYGIIGLCLVPLSLFAMLASNKCASIKYAVFILVLLVLLRATTEPILFPTALDFLYFLYFFMFFRHSPSKSAPGRVCANVMRSI